jgi:DNA-binding transcriptional regulator LsrR (DeoR family)
MRQVFEAFRLAYDHGRSQREIARALGLSQSTVNDYLRRPAETFVVRGWSHRRVRWVPTGIRPAR